MAQDTINKPKEELKREAQHIEKTRGGHPAAQPTAPVVARPVRRYRALVFQGYVVAAAIAFMILFVFASQVPYFGFDLTVARAVQSFHPYWWDVLMRFVSGLGFNPLVYILAGLTILFVYTVGLRWEAVMLLFAAVGVSILGAVVKIVVHRDRPSSALVHVLEILHDYSFPSGHTLLFTAFGGFLLFLIYTLTPHSWSRTIGLIFLGGLIALVGLSRVYEGEHWPSDVLGGYLLGSLWLVITIYIYRWGKSRFFVNQPVAPT
jgi:membrane-associated phospholipid phosphatase